LKADGTLERPEPVRLFSAPVAPFSRERFQELSKTVEAALAIEELISNHKQDNTSPGQGIAGVLQQRDEEDNKFGMALLLCDLFPKVAEAAGLFGKDITAVVGQRYIYKISLAHVVEKMSVVPAVVVVDVAEAKPLQPFRDVEAEFRDHEVTVSWPILLHRGVYTAYVVERSEDGKNFAAVTDLPYMPMSQEGIPQEAHFVDSLAHNGKIYYYQIKGITSFGEVGPASNVVSGSGKDDLSGMLVLREVKRDAKNNVVVRWDFPPPAESKVKGFIVERGVKAEGPFTTTVTDMLSTQTRDVVDKTITASAYYRVRVVDGADQELTHSQAYYFHVEDNTPPATPAAVWGKADKNGIVSLRWKRNGDPDLLGYRVFSSNDLRHEFMEVTRDVVSDTIYQDTINVKVMNKHLYYALVAVDRNYNTSDYSPAFQLARPDVIAPAAAVFSKAEVKDHAVSLQWVNSPADDVVRYTLYRTVITDDKSTTIQAGMTHWDAHTPQTAYVDATVQAGQTYQYMLEAADSSGNVSTALSDKVMVRVPLPADVTEFKALIDRDNKLIILRWQYPAKYKKFLLYRCKGDEPFSLYQRLETVDGEFRDKQVSMNSTYSYRIQLVLEDNSKTKLSDVLKVPY
jgi:fibronectin type 3 domain-containing protein